MLPVGRPASAWPDDASVVFPTPDGKLFPVGLASSQQTKHTEIIAGEPGTGKSLMLNMLNNAMVSNAQQRLPFIAVVDKGYSAQGQIQLIRDSLPAARKDEAIGIVLRNHPDHCRNMFDVQLGAQYPIEPELTWLVGVLVAMCIEPSTGSPPNERDTRTLIERAVMLAYRDLAEGNTRKYAEGEAPDVDRALRESGLLDKYDEEWWEICPYYDVRDMLFEAGYPLQAQRAQFMAVPELNDMQAYLNSDEIRSAFGSIGRANSNETLLDYVMRCLEQAKTDFQMLAGRTQFVINPTPASSPSTSTTSWATTRGRAS